MFGLIGEGIGIAVKVFKLMGILLKEVCIEVEKIIGCGFGFVVVEILFMLCVKCVLEFAFEEAR